jgi:NAD(P)-dependent dehydrogenase (short-subunit alcohol dehydrogenase family)
MVKKYENQVAVVTGGAKGIGGAVAKRLAENGASVVVADIEDEIGKNHAESIGATYFHCDVSDVKANTDLMEFAVDTYSGLDIVHLNAGIASGVTFGAENTIEAYRKITSINLDGVVYGMNAAITKMQQLNGGRIVATASIAGLMGLSLDPFYTITKHGVVGLVRAVGPNYISGKKIEINAICPSFVDTDIIAMAKEFLVQAKFPILDVSDVADTFEQILESNQTGNCWYVIPGRKSEPFLFRNIPGPQE